ncbi:uncharacterized protein [Musca autumnalis]|uniref:uncharacterized protein n=1 Tax=Musca autumnalis TaxID=221902 RepID=UPI003CF673E7
MTFKGFKINFDLSNGTTFYGDTLCSSKMDFDFVSFKRSVLSKLPDELKNKGELPYYWVDTNGDKIDIVDPYDYYALLEMTCSEFSQVYVGLKKSSIAQMDLPTQPTPNKFYKNQSYSSRDTEHPKFIKITHNLLNGTTFTRYFDTRYFVKHNIEGYLFQDLKKLHSLKLRYYWIDSHGDEVDIFQTTDYNACWYATSIPHIYIVPVIPSKIEKDNPSTTTTNNTTSKTAFPTAFEGQLSKANVSHDANNISTNVKCDSCVMEPIVGFRYKCAQCPNYDHLMMLKPNVDGEKAKESDRYAECRHVHQSFLAHLYEMMDNLIKDFGKVETAADTTKISTAYIQDSNCKITLESTTNTGEQNVDEISLKEGIIEDKVIHDTLATKESDSMTPIGCEQKEKAITVAVDGTSNNRTDSVTTHTKIPEKTVDHDLILQTLDEAANVVPLQRAQEKSSEIANKVIHETLSGEVVEGGVEVVTRREQGNTSHQRNEILKSLNVSNTRTHSSKLTENNGEPKKKITSYGTYCWVSLQMHSVWQLYIIGENCQESDRNEECNHVHQSFLTHLYEMMNNLVKGFGIGETDAGTTQNPTENINQRSKCKIALESTNIGGPNVDAISVKAGAKVTHETSAAKDSDTMTSIDCDQMGMVTPTTGYGTSNDKTDSAKTKIAKTNLDTLIWKTLSDIANKETAVNAINTTALIDKELKQKSSSNASKKSTSSGNADQITNPSLKDFIQSHDPELVRNGFEIWKNFNNMFAKMFDIMDEVEGAVVVSHASNTKNSTTTSSAPKSAKNNVTPKKLQEDSKTEFNDSISKQFLNNPSQKDSHEATSPVTTSDSDSDRSRTPSPMSKYCYNNIPKFYR